jgi:hypothetical protein
MAVVGNTMSIRPSRNGLSAAAAARLNAIRIVRAYSRFRELSDQEFAMLLDTIEEAFVTSNNPEVYQ